MTDRELLELAKYNDKEMMKIAGKAIGEFVIEFAGKLWINGAKTKWNPLDDDGDALRLAVKLTMVIACYEDSCEIENLNGESLAYEVNADPYAATRRAIVRAAAEIGKGMT